MRYNIYLGFDDVTESAVKDLRAKLYEKLGKNLLETRNYFMRPAKKMPPHILVFVFDAADQEQTIKKFKEFAAAAVPFDVDLYTTDCFRGECDETLFIKPRLSNELKDCYLRCLGLFSDSFIMPPYRSLKKWQPHVTVTKIETGMAHLEAEELIENLWKPIVVRVRKVGLINVQKPLEVLAERVW